MAVTTVAKTPVDVGFAVNATSADASGAEVILANATAGVSIHLERILISSAAAINITIGDGESASAVETVCIGPVYMAANSTVSYVFRRPIKLTAAKALVVDASGAGAICVFAEGYIA